MNNPIYTITCMTKLESDKHGWPNFGDTAFMGFFYEKEEAIKAVKNNSCDIWEHCYSYAVIEEVPAGIYAFLRKRWFYKYDRRNNKYIEIEEPAFMKHIANVL